METAVQTANIPKTRNVVTILQLSCSKQDNSLECYSRAIDFPDGTVRKADRHVDAMHIPLNRRELTTGAVLRLRHRTDSRIVSRRRIDRGYQPQFTPSV